MKSRLITIVLLLSLGSGTDAAYPPPPVSAYCRITCIVEEKAEWNTDRRAFNDLSRAVLYEQTNNSTPVLIINSNHESMLEMDSDGTFRSGNYPIDIIVSVISERQTGSQEDSRVTTITACWKI
jgi:hypothetical protein